VKFSGDAQIHMAQAMRKRLRLRTMRAEATPEDNEKQMKAIMASINNATSA
jgi:hypothetical protein